MLSNTNPTAPYRGAGRPEAIYLIERLIDDAARELGVDRIELRRKNMLPESALPYQSPVGPYYDCGEFEKNLDMALEARRRGGLRGRARRSPKKRGRLRGLGIVNAIEQAAGTAQPEYAEIRFNPSGTATLLMGTKAQGQGHETMFKQILNERLGIDPDDVQFIDGDTDRVAFGMGTNGSRSTVLGGSALYLAADKVIEKGKKLAGHLLEAGEQDIEFADGSFKVKGTDKAVSLKQVAMAAFNPTRWPEGRRLRGRALRERDLPRPEGHLSQRLPHLRGRGRSRDGRGHGRPLLRGRRCRHGDEPDRAEGPDPWRRRAGHRPDPVRAGRVGSRERPAPDRELPRLRHAARRQMIPNMEVKSNPVPTKFNPLGAKGAGEAGTVGAMPVVMNAIMDALAPLGVTRRGDACDGAERVACDRGRRRSRGAR